MNAISGERFVRAKEFYTRLGISRTTFYRLVTSGKIPKPIAVTDRIRAWTLSQMEAVMNTLLEGKGML